MFKNILFSMMFLVSSLLANTLGLEDNGDGTWNVSYSSEDIIAGFQFDVDDATVNSASGGDATANGFMISASSLTVLGFSLSGGTIPSGNGTLLVLDLSGMPTGLSEIVVSDPSGSALDFTYDGGDVYGCTDMDACNYNADATADDGSCDYGAMCWDGSYECDAADCSDEPGVTTLSFGAVSDGSLEVYLSNDAPVAGFQFNISGITITGASGGSAEAAGFMVSTSATTVIGFSLSGATIPSGDGVLVNVSFTGSGEACLSDAVLSDSSGNALDTELGDCVTIEDDCAEGYDDCGVCGGDNSSCADCAGVPNGDAEEDECGVCDGPGANVECWDGSYECDAADCSDEPGVTTLSFGAVSDGSLEVYLSNDAPVAGFQFNISGITITGASGGSAEAAGFMVSTSATTVIGFSLSGATIPSGDGVLVNVSFTGSGEACLSDAVLSDSSGNALDTELGDCVTIEDDCAEGYDDCGVCGGDNSSCADCAGVPNGDAEEDECGVCDGPGANVECWDGSYECDAADCSDEPGVTTLSFGAVSDGSLEVYLSNDAPVAGFQFNISGITITGASGGSAEAAGFMVSTSATTVIGFSLSGATIPSGDGVLVNVSFTGSGEACLSDAVLSDSSGNALDTELGDCVTIEDDCAEGYDDCGVCGGDNSSCADCAGVPNGDAEEDECGVCDGPGANVECWDGSYECDAADCSDEPGVTTLSFGAVSDGSLEVYLSNDAPVAGFQFNISGITITGASGGSAEAAGFMVSTSATTVIGFSLSGATIPSGDGVLVNVSFTGSGEACLSDAVLSDSSGNALDTELGDCVTIEDDCAEGYDDCGVCGGDNSSCADCAGVPNGDAEEDECGVCDGPGANVECWDGSYECDAADCSDEPGVTTLSFGAVSDGSLEVYLSNDAPVAGFQFNISGITITGASGGSAEAAGFMVSTSATTVIGFSLSGATIPSGDGVLVNVSFTGSGEACLSDAVLSDSSGNALDTELGDCVTIEDDCAEGYDDCGVCGGDNSSCADCAGVPNGDAEEDECGVCDGPGANVECWDGSYECDAADCSDEPGVTTLSFGAVSDGSLEVYLSNDAPVAGFQFNISGITITGASGGSAEAAGFMVSTSATTVIGFSLSGATIPSGDGVLVNVSFTGSGEACLSDAVLSDSSGNALDTELGDCVTIEDDCAEGYDDCGVCGGDNSSCADCAGVPNGDAEEDECGVCDGPGANVECWDGSYECDAADCSDEPGVTTLSFGAVSDGSLEVYLSNDAPVAGFQFNISGITITGASGGSAEAAGFMVSTSATTVIGFSLSGATIPSGDGVLVNVSFTGSGEACLSDAVLSDSSGNALDTELGDCVYIGDEPEPPSAPTGMGADAGDGSVTLGWNASDGAESYNIYREQQTDSPCADQGYQFTDCAGYCFNDNECCEEEDCTGVDDVPCIEWIGDGYCDCLPASEDPDGVGTCPEGQTDSWGLDFNCEEWDFDAGDCEGEGWSGCEEQNCNAALPTASNCYCDPLCEYYNDCCDDACEVCGNDCGEREDISVNDMREPVKQLIINSYSISREYVLIGSTSDTEYTDEEVANDMGYCYYTTAVNDDGESEGSDIVCATPEAGDVYGCTDMDACNYDSDANMDDGSCEYAEENYDCDGNCIVEVDCAGECGGGAVEDACGECNGDGACIEVILSASIGADSSSISIHYNSTWPIAAFQFTVQGIGNMSVFGGDAESNGLDVLNTDYMVLGYSVNLVTIPAGSGILVEITGDLPESCNDGPPEYCIIALEELIISNIVFSDNSATPFSSCYEQNGDCIPSEYESILGCQNPIACNYNPDATVADGSCEYAEENYDCDGNCIVEVDCAGECGGSAEVDECGECGGDGIDEGACDCSGNVEDCAGECGGSAEVDECGECGGDGIDEGACDCSGNVEDCAGVCGGSAENCPGWEDDPGAYEFTATIAGAIVLFDGVQMGEDGDLLAALDSDGNVRGVGLQLTPPFGPYEGTTVYEVQLRSNDAGDLLHFQYYDASSDEVLDISETYEFVINDIIGDVITPWELNIQTTVDLSIDLISGWNWISFNVDVEDNSTASILESLGDAAIFIGSQSSGTATYYPDYGQWLGGLSTLEPTQMYTLKMAETMTLTITGVPVEVASTPIGLISGWNWIGYLPQNSGDLVSALASVEDLAIFIGSQSSGTATYYPDYSQWLGGLSTLQPGNGYTLKMTGPGELIYPEFDGLARLDENKQEVVLSEKISDWDFHYGDYEFIGTIHTSIDSRVDFNGDVVGVFVDHECRGIAERMYFPFDDSYFYIIQVYSNVADGEEMTFKYYDSTHDEVVEYTESIEFTPDMVFGDGFNTFGLSREALPTPEEYNLSDAYPNPFNPTTNLSFSVPTEGVVSLNIYDMTGRLVSTLVDGNLNQGYHSITWNGMDSNGHAVSSGMYIYSLKGEGVSITKKMVLMK